jgi:hypothetical protein
MSSAKSRLGSGSRSDKALLIDLRTPMLLTSQAPKIKVAAGGSAPVNGQRDENNATTLLNTVIESLSDQLPFEGIARILWIDEAPLARDAVILSGVGHYAARAIIEHCGWEPVLPLAARFDAQVKLSEAGITPKWEGPSVWQGKVIGGRTGHPAARPPQTPGDVCRDGRRGAPGPFVRRSNHSLGIFC